MSTSSGLIHSTKRRAIASSSRTEFAAPFPRALPTPERPIRFRLGLREGQADIADHIPPHAQQPPQLPAIVPPDAPSLDQCNRSALPQLPQDISGVSSEWKAK